MRDLEDLMNFAKVQLPVTGLVLCTLVRKHGSSYRTVGAKKLVTANGESCGTLSGGCLEGAIEKTAKSSINKKCLPILESFTTMNDEDRLLGYQTGCQGRIEILFEEVERGTSLESLAVMLAYGPRAGVSAVQISLAPKSLGSRTLLQDSDMAGARNELNKINLNYSNHSCLDFWIHPVELTVVGCGADSDPYIEFAHALGWRLKFIDYRGDLVTRMQSLGVDAQQIAAAEVHLLIRPGPQAAVILATHNYEADLEILRGLVNLQFGYLGLLGPASRWQNLKKDLHDFFDIEIQSTWEKKVFAPAGIFTRGRSPAEIALSVFSQIQSQIQSHIQLNGQLNEMKKTAQGKVWTIILAAGESRRFGSPKALALWKSKTLFCHALEKARNISGINIIVVTGAHQSLLESEIHTQRKTPSEVVIVHNPNWSDGLGSSISAGIAALITMDASAYATVIIPIDQPLVTNETLEELVKISSLTDRCALSSDDERCGPPAVLPQRLFKLASNLSGQKGLKSTLRPSDTISIYSPNALRDADSPEELAVLAREFC